MKTIDSVIRERLEGMKQWTFHYTYECPKCGAFYGKDDTYCTNDRTKIVKKETKYAETLQEPYNQAIDDTLTLLSHSLAEARREWVEETMKVVDRHTAWKPTIGFGSDEEKGFQKGLIAEANLLKKDLTDLLTGDNQLSEHDLELIKEGRAMSDRDTRRGV